MERVMQQEGQKKSTGACLSKACKRRWVMFGSGLIAFACFAGEPAGAPRIFRCEVNGKITFADRPCAAVSSTEIVLPPVNSYQANAYQANEPRVVSQSGGRSAAKGLGQRQQSTKQTESRDDEQQRQKQRCQRLADQLVNIENTLRAGYSAKQGERLRERQRQLEQKRRTERCG